MLGLDRGQVEQQRRGHREQPPGGQQGQAEQWQEHQQQVEQAVVGQAGLEGVAGHGRQGRQQAPGPVPGDAVVGLEQPRGPAGVQRHQQVGGDQEPGQAGPGGAPADRPTTTHDQQQPEPGDDQPQLRAAERGQGQPQRHGPVPAAVGGQHGQGEQAGGDRLGMELPADRPLHPGVGQVGDGHGQPGGRVAEVAAPQPVQDQRRQGQEQHLEQQQQARVGPEPVQGGDQDHDVGGLLAEQVEAADGHERRPGPRQQPGPLVVDAEVEPVGGEAGVGRPGGADERGHEDGQGQPKGDRAQPRRRDPGGRDQPPPRLEQRTLDPSPTGGGPPVGERSRCGGGGPARCPQPPTRGSARARRSGRGAAAAAGRPAGPAARPRRRG